jgi:hypothetical protein
MSSLSGLSGLSCYWVCSLAGGFSRYRGTVVIVLSADMHRFNYIPRLEVLQFMDACEHLLSFKREQGGLTEEEEQALQSYMDRLQELLAIADRYEKAD